MFDFRYHALSLIAVFVALAVGLLLGVAIGDEELVSSAKEDVRDSLRRDVREAQEDADDARRDLRAARRFDDEAYPLLVSRRLDGRNLALVFLGASSDRAANEVRDALDHTGGRLRATAVVSGGLDLDGIADRAPDTRYADLPDGDEDLVRGFGERIGIQLVQGGRLIGRVRGALFDTLAGDLVPFDGVVLARSSDDRDGEEARLVQAFEEGLAAGLRSTDVPVVGIERTTTEPSQIPWYRDRGLSSVDNVDQTAGRTAMVYVLAGVNGTFGVKPTAGALLPKVS